MARVPSASAPDAVLVFVFLVTLAYSMRGYAHGPIFLALIVAFFTVVMVRVGIDPVLPAAAGSVWGDAITAIGAA